MMPNVAVIQIQNPHWRGIRLWIPLFLLWIPVVLLSPLLLLILLVVCLAWKISFSNSIIVLWDILSALPGTHVRVAAENNHVLVKIL